MTTGILAAKIKHGIENHLLSSFGINSTPIEIMAGDFAWQRRRNDRLMSKCEAMSYMAHKWRFRSMGTGYLYMYHGFRHETAYRCPLEIPEAPMSVSYTMKGINIAIEASSSCSIVGSRKLCLTMMEEMSENDNTMAGLCAYFCSAPRKGVRTNYI